MRNLYFDETINNENNSCESISNNDYHIDIDNDEKLTNEIKTYLINELSHERDMYNVDQIIQINFKFMPNEHIDDEYDVLMIIINTNEFVYEIEIFNICAKYKNNQFISCEYDIDEISVGTHENN